MKLASLCSKAAIFAVASAFAVLPAAYAAPISSCAVSGQSLTCNLYESDNGLYSNVVTTGGISIIPGILELTTAGGSIANPASWLDAVVFTPSTVQLISALSPLFPSVATVNAGLNGAIVESLTNPTTYTADPNTYHLFVTMTSAATPEPGSLLLVGSGISALWAAGRRRLSRS